MPAVTVIVPARNAQDTIGDTLEALATQTARQEVEVVVVDDGSRDSTAAVVEDSGVVDRFLPSRGQGAGAARNAGAAVASGRLLAFTDADCRPAPGWIAAGLDAARSAEIVQGPIRPPAEEVPGPFDHAVYRERLSPLYESANLFVDRESFLHLGGFGSGMEERREGRLGAPFGEDVVFGWRARRAGMRTVFSPEAVVHHALVRRPLSEFISEHRRLGNFARLGRQVPELRDEFFYRRFFLSRRSAAFDLALGGLALAIGGRPRLGLAAAAPYGALVYGRARRWGRAVTVEVALATVAADATAFASLARGSLGAGWLLL